MSVSLTKISDYDAWVTDRDSNPAPYSDLDAEWGAWLEATYDPDRDHTDGHDRLNDVAEEAWDNRNNPEWWDHS